jgi:hypothetical protein
MAEIKYLRKVTQVVSVLHEKHSMEQLMNGLVGLHKEHGFYVY